MQVTKNNHEFGLVVGMRKGDPEGEKKQNLGVPEVLVGAGGQGMKFAAQAESPQGSGI